MAPKKCVENGNKSPRKRAPKPPKPPPKPPLKTPTVIKVRIPIFDLPGCNGMEPKLTKKQLTVQKKVDLANEVALQQLTNSVPICSEPPPQTIPAKTNGKSKRKATTPVKFSPKRTKNKTPDPVGLVKSHSEETLYKLSNETSEKLCTEKKPKSRNKLTRPKNPPKVKSETENVSQHNTTSDETFQPKVPRKFFSKKTPIKKNTDVQCETKEQNLQPPIIEEEPINVPIITNLPQNIQVPTPKRIRKKPVRRVSKKKSAECEVSENGITIKTENPNPPKAKPKSVRKITPPDNKPSTQTRKSARIPKRVQRFDTLEINHSYISKDIESSPILDQDVEDTSKPGSVGSRKTSIGSNNSSLSWTQDISTSNSTTTCVTVNSNDFVRFDKKLPVIRVNQVKSPGEKHLEPKSPEKHLEPKSPEKHLEPKSAESEDVSSSDSDSDTDSSSSSSSEDIGASIRSPRLSTSSVTSRGDGEPRRDTDVIIEALKNLTMSMKSFDARMVQLKSTISPMATCRPERLYQALEAETRAISLCRTIDCIVRERAPSPSLPPHDTFENFASDRVPYKSFEHDDDDALSLFAESITGMEMSRMSSTPARTPVQEYVPAAVVRRPALSYNYRPTEITELKACEKQSADSTSLGVFRVPPPPVAPPVPETLLFKDVCFHNLVSRCPFEAGCMYRHYVPSPEEVAVGLRALSLARFHSERKLLDRYEGLRKYEAAFAAEHRRRSEEPPLEMALSHLNGSNNYWEVLLRPCGGRLFGELLLVALADTANFSRFKPAFVKLGRFVSEHGRPVDIDVATKILERVSILPAEADVARAMIQVVNNSPANIFQTDAMLNFEAKLATLDATLCDELLRAKGLHHRPPQTHDREKRYTSPDTTHYDNLNNLLPEPIPQRAVDFKRSISNTAITFDHTQISPYTQTFKEPYKWNNGSYPRPTRRPTRRPMVHRHMDSRPYNMRMQVNRQVNYGYQNQHMTPNRYHRRPRNGI